MFKTRKGLLLIVLLLVFTGAGQSFIREHLPDLFSNHPDSIQLTQGRMNHILHGDDRGGGHLYGTGKPCKSEFPKDWNEAKIIGTVKSIAANDNLDWEKESNGYYTAEEKVNGINVRVVLSDDKARIITAYPLNVKKNSCNSSGEQVPANDNAPIFKYNE